MVLSSCHSSWRLKAVFILGKPSMWSSFGKGKGVGREWGDDPALWQIVSYYDARQRCDALASSRCRLLLPEVDQVTWEMWKIHSLSFHSTTKTLGDKSWNLKSMQIRSDTISSAARPNNLARPITYLLTTGNGENRTQFMLRKLGQVVLYMLGKGAGK